MLKIGLIGYGQMGKLLEQMAASYNCKVLAIYDPKLGLLPSKKELQQCDVFIEFTQPDSVVANIEMLANHGKAIVIGTTGWLHELNNVKKIAAEKKIGILYGSNFSLGMNLFYEIIRKTAATMSKCSEYDVLGYEKHHSLKKDSPSGTARKICDIILEEMPHKKTAQFDKLERKILAEELHFASIRGGAVPGTHAVEFDSLADTIELKHIARNRNGFAMGALKAANWISDKKTVYQFETIFSELL